MRRLVTRLAEGPVLAVDGEEFHPVHTEETWTESMGVQDVVREDGPLRTPMRVAAFDVERRAMHLTSDRILPPLSRVVDNRHARRKAAALARRRK